jgi:predicted Rossmann fold nucleotide-binding protein DprA/Smf involved in DNA uptake
MKIAVVGSRGLSLSEEMLAMYLSEADEIVSGGAKGVDTCVARYAKKKEIPLTEFLPDYSRYGKGAPVVRNKQIVDYADKVVVFWDGSSKGTLSVIRYAERINKSCEIMKIENRDG